MEGMIDCRNNIICIADELLAKWERPLGIEQREPVFQAGQAVDYMQSGLDIDFDD